MGYEWTMYSEYVPLLLQDLLLFLLMMRQEREDRDRRSPQHTGRRSDSPLIRLTSGYSRSSLRTFVALTIAVHCLIASRTFPRSVPILAIAVSSPIGVVSKVLQLAQIIRAKSAGTVSATTWFLNFLSTSCRLLSVLLTHADRTIVLSLTASAVLNAAVGAAVLYYPPVTPVDHKTQEMNGDTKSELEPNANEIKKKDL